MMLKFIKNLISRKKGKGLEPYLKLEMRCVCGNTWKAEMPWQYWPKGLDFTCGVCGQHYFMITRDKDFKPRMQWVSVKDSMPEFERPVLFMAGETVYSGVRVNDIGSEPLANAFHTIEPGGVLPCYMIDEVEFWMYPDELLALKPE